MIPAFKRPAKVAVASPAQGITPNMPGEPGELRRGGSGPVTARGGAEAAQLKNYSGRVKKGMRMGTLHSDLSVPARHRFAACSAKDGLCRINPFLVLVLFHRQTGHTTPLPLISPKTIAGYNVRLHLPDNNQQ